MAAVADLNGQPAGIELAAALRYAGGGVNVFPVNGRKVPLTGNGGFKHATRDCEQIERLRVFWRGTEMNATLSG